MICEDFITGLLNDMYISATGSPVWRTTTGSCDSRGSTVLDLLDLGQHVGDRAVGIGIEPQVERDRADVLLARTR